MWEAAPAGDPQRPGRSKHARDRPVATGLGVAGLAPEPVGNGPVDGDRPGPDGRRRACSRQSTRVGPAGAPRRGRHRRLACRTPLARLRMAGTPPLGVHGRPAGRHGVGGAAGGTGRPGAGLLRVDPGRCEAGGAVQRGPRAAPSRPDRCPGGRQRAPTQHRLRRAATGAGTAGAHLGVTPLQAAVSLQLGLVRACRADRRVG